MNLTSPIDRKGDRHYKQIASASIGSLLLLLGTNAAASAASTGLTGGNQPIDNFQPSLAIQYIIATQGIFPSTQGSGVCGISIPCIGSISALAGYRDVIPPGGWEFANGQLLSISQNQDLFNLLGATYGGDGITTFALPNLQGRTPIGTGTGAGLSTRTLGEQPGSTRVTLDPSQLPSHTHTLPGTSDVTGATGSNQPVNNVQPSLGLTYAISTRGTFGNCGNGASCIGEIGAFDYNFVPGGWLPADGRLLPIVNNEALFFLLGTRYGGNGSTNFALPDLQGRIAIGTGTGAGLTTRNLGDKIGTETVTLTEAQLPSHTHTVPGTSDLTGATGSNQPVNNIQPSLALTYAIATQGTIAREGSSSCFGAVCIGQVGLFAFDENFLNTNVQGWLPADGRVLPIASNTTLFSVLGTTYGGDGRSTFALPDLRGRTAIGTGFGSGGQFYTLGQIVGSQNNILNVSQLASHEHAIAATAVPEPFTIIGTLIGGAAALRLRTQLKSTIEEQN
jgi:microcystin-dependent protein